jgi:hypothetical protein
VGLPTQNIAPASQIEAGRREWDDPATNAADDEDFDDQDEVGNYQVKKLYNLTIKIRPSA